MTTQDATVTRYRYPERAAAELAKRQCQAAIFEAIELDTDALCTMAAFLAPTYITSDKTPATALQYYKELIANDEQDEAKDGAIDALTLQALYGDNGSDAQRMSSRLTAWVDSDTPMWRIADSGGARVHDEDRSSAMLIPKCYALRNIDATGVVDGDFVRTDSPVTTCPHCLRLPPLRCSAIAHRIIGGTKVCDYTLDEDANCGNATLHVNA